MSIRMFLQRALTGSLVSIGALALLPSVGSAAANDRVPDTMKAIVQHGTGGPEVLKLESVATPKPGERQVLVRVYAAGVNPADWKMRAGRLGSPPPSSAGAEPAKSIPGSELSGVVAAIGSGITGFKVGDAVYGQTFPRKASYAEYAVVDVDALVAKPEQLTFAQAAGIPVVTTTALREMRAGDVKAGNTVVIVGAAGGVGSAAVQLAKARGARVIAIASSKHNDYLRKLGANEVVNYDVGNGVDKIKDADVVLNQAERQGPELLRYLKRGGVLVSITGVIPEDQCKAAGVSCPNQMTPPQAGGQTTAAQLDEINKLVAAGKFTVQVSNILPLSEAAQAQELSRSGHAQGKIIVAVDASANER